MAERGCVGKVPAITDKKLNGVLHHQTSEHLLIADYPIG